MPFCRKAKALLELYGRYNISKVSPSVKMLLCNKEPSVTKQTSCSVPPSSYNIRTRPINESKLSNGYPGTLLLATLVIVVLLVTHVAILLIVPVLIVRCICHWQRSQTHPSKAGKLNSYTFFLLYNLPPNPWIARRSGCRTTSSSGSC